MEGYDLLTVFTQETCFDESVRDTGARLGWVTTKVVKSVSIVDFTALCLIAEKKGVTLTVRLGLKYHHT